LVLRLTGALFARLLEINVQFLYKKAAVICPEGRGAKRSGNPLSRCFSLSGFATLAAGGLLFGLNHSPQGISWNVVTHM
jgi:hypothetical protein